MLRSGIGRKAQDMTERTLGVPSFGASVLICDVSSGDFMMKEGNGVEGLLGCPSGIACS